MTKSEIAITLEKGIDQLDREARDAGHDPHPWSHDETFVAHTGCRNCGRSMVVRVYSDHTFKSGLPGPCTANGKT